MQSRTERPPISSWVTGFNIFFVLFAVLPIMAPLLQHYGFDAVALMIYRAYGVTCHQLPSHSDTILGHQIAVCQRCNAIHLTMAAVGVFYALRVFRPSIIHFKWFLLFMIPIGIDGGMGMVSELVRVIPIGWLWAVGLVLILGGLMLFQQRKMLSWHVYLFFAAGPLVLIAIHLFGPYESDWWMRTITGSIYGLGAIWFIYPLFDAQQANVGY